MRLDKKKLLFSCVGFLFAAVTVNSFAVKHNRNVKKQQQQAVVADIEVKPIHWFTNYKKATESSSGKPFILFFTGSDWCGWCKKMEHEILSNNEFMSEVSQLFTFVKVDFPLHSKLLEEEAEQNSMLKQKYHISGYPTLIVLDKDQEFLVELQYLPIPGREYGELLKKYSK